MQKTRSLDFSKLSMQDALDLAVLIEEEARDRYEEFTSQMEIHHNEEAARFFRFMAKNEEKHREALAIRRGQLFANAPSAVRREMLFDIEAPEYSDANAFMTVRGALEVALRAEEKAHGFFKQALTQIQDGAVRALFEELCEEEVEHQDLVKKELAKAPPDPPHRAIDFSDDPVSH